MGEVSKFFRVTIAGTNALLMHNGMLADPLSAYTKELKALTSNRKKSDDDHMKIAEAEFRGGLYYSKELGPYIPGDVIDAAIRGGAKKKKLGQVFFACVKTRHSEYPLKYKGQKKEHKGPNGMAALWNTEDANGRTFVDRRGAGVQDSRIIRTRPKFEEWEVTFELELAPSELNPENVKEAIVLAGRYVGLCDFRPKYGTFEVTKFEEIPG